VYTVDYSPEARHGLDARTAGLAPPLGTLGVVSVVEVRIATRDLASLRGKWAMLLAPWPASADGTLVVGKGPGVHIVKGEQEKIAAIVLKVASLKAAKDVLHRSGLLGQVHADRVTIDSAKAQGLEILLLE
jgi:hypothetical protein